MPCFVCELGGELASGWSGALGAAGYGYYADDKALVSRRPGFRAPVGELVSLCEETTSRILLASFGAEGDPAPPAEAQAPFRSRAWLFGSSGDLDPLLKEHETVMLHLPEFLARDVRGRSAGELLFRLFLAELHRSGHLDDAGPLAADAADALGRAIHHCQVWTDGRFGAYHGVGVMISNGQLLFGAGVGTSLHYRFFEGLQHCQRCGQAGDDANTRRVRESHAGFRGVALATGMVGPTGPGWMVAPDGGLVSVRRGLDLQVRPIAGLAPSS